MSALPARRGLGSGGDRQAQDGAEILQDALGAAVADVPTVQVHGAEDAYGGPFHATSADHSAGIDVLAASATGHTVRMEAHMCISSRALLSPIPLGR